MDVERGLEDASDARWVAGQPFCTIRLTTSLA
jgi:hypothetical protein